VHKSTTKLCYIVKYHKVPVLLAVSAQSHYVSLVNCWQSVNRNVKVEQMKC